MFHIILEVRNGLNFIQQITLQRDRWKYLPRGGSRQGNRQECLRERQITGSNSGSHRDKVTTERSYRAILLTLSRGLSRQEMTSWLYTISSGMTT